MCLLVTSVQDPYERLWCVHELDEALDVMDVYKAEGDARGEAFVVVEFSQRAWDLYRGKMVTHAFGQGVDVSLMGEEQQLQMIYAFHRQDVKCEDAICGQADDTAMIRRKVEAKEGGWERLNDRMARFRMPRQTCDVEKAASANA